MNIAIVLQARMNSRRLPGKVLRDLLGKPMLVHILDRLMRCREANQLVVATSTGIVDDPVESLCRSINVPCFRGSEDDVLDRYYQCAVSHKFDHIVRCTGDNPFVCPDELDHLIRFHLRENNDYSFNNWGAGRSLPLGVGSEVFTFDALLRSWKEGHKPNHREHVNEYIEDHRDLFRIGLCPVSNEAKVCPSLRLTVDTVEDFVAAEGYYREYIKDMYIDVVDLIKGRSAIEA